MFQDEAGFGRINKPKYCWCKKGIRPSVPCHHIREYRYAYGAVEPTSGESCFLIMPYCNTNCMNVFLNHLSMSYPNDIIILVCDGAAWHKAKALIVPENIRLVFIPPYTPEMNPIEQIADSEMKSFKLSIKLLSAYASLSNPYLQIRLRVLQRGIGLLKRLIKE